MSTFGSNLELHQKIGDSLHKLSKSELSIQELENLLGFSRELYERILVLRYKAFENQIHGERNVVVPQPENKVQPAVEELIVPDEPPAIEFALFGEMPEQSSQAADVPFVLEPILEKSAPSEPVVSEPKLAVQEPVAQTDAKTADAPATQNTSSGSLLDKLTSNNLSNSLGDQLKKSHIDSLVSVLTLNDRIRFTKNLFDANSDTFNAAIQLLDAQKSVAEARDLLGQYASRYEWDLEDNNTIDFYEFVERRYA
jgi:hypothetical protein